MYLDWASDLVIDSTGDISVAVGTIEIQQRVVRRFLTNSAQTDTYSGAPLPPDYLFDGSYGGNARRYVDSLVNEETAGSIQYNLLNQIAQEAEVARTPSPVVTVTQLDNGFAVQATVAQQDGTVVLLPQIEITN